jgi:hypothetical protein
MFVHRNLTVIRYLFADFLSYRYQPCKNSLKSKYNQHQASSFMVYREIAELEAHIQWAEGNHVDGSSDPSSSDGASNCDPIDHPETFKYDINGKLIGGPSELNTSAHEGAGLDQAGAEQSGEGTDPATGAANPTLVYGMLSAWGCCDIDAVTYVT